MVCWNPLLVATRIEKSPKTLTIIFVEHLRDGFSTIYMKMDVPNSVAYATQTPLFKWYVLRHGSKNIFQKDMCLQNTERCAQNMITILSSIVNNLRMRVNICDVILEDLKLEMVFVLCDELQSADHKVSIFGHVLYTCIFTF